MKSIYRLMFSAVLVAACYTTALYAAEAAAESLTAPQPTLVAGWLQAIIGLVVTAIGTFALPYLHNAAAQARMEATTASLTNREALLKQIKVYLLEQADQLAVDRWPLLVQKIQSGQLSGSTAIKAELYLWGDELKANTIKYFKANGIDIITSFGEPAIDDLITWAANATSPFPGKEAATEVLKHNIIPFLLQNGVAWVRDHYFKNGATPIIEAKTLTQQPGEREVRVFYKVVTV